VRVHKGKAIVAGIAALALALTGCSNSSDKGNGGNADLTAGTHGTGNYKDCAKSPLDCNQGKTKAGGSITYVLEKTIPGWNQNFSPSNVFEVAEVEDGLLPAAFVGTPDLKPTMNPDLLTSAEQTSASPQTLVYKIAPKAVWNDGTPVNFNDFKYIKDASDGTTCPKCGATTSAGYNAIKTITGSDNGKTVTIVMKTPFADWKSMFTALLPAHLAAQHGDLTTAAGLNSSYQYFDKTVPTYSYGPLQIKSYNKDTSITEVPNPRWYGKTKSTLKQVVFRMITDQTQEVPALQNNEVQALYAQPNADMVTNAQKIPGVSTYVGKGLVWEHLSFNEKNQFLSDKTLRTAIFVAVDRESILRRTVAQYAPGVKALNNHVYVPGQPGYTDNVTKTKQGSGKLSEAKKLLTSAGYSGVGSALKTQAGKAVTFRCTYSAGNTNRQQICEIVQATLKKLGIKVTLKTTTDLSELGSGDYDMIVFAWVGAPFVVAGIQQIYELKGGADYGSNNDPAAEALINKAATQTDPAAVQKLMNQADVKITADAYELPLFQKPTFTATYDNIVNIRDNATNTGPPYNVQEWGFKAT
jgi:glutathione transport system substrate-binding protein